MQFPFTFPLFTPPPPLQPNSLSPLSYHTSTIYHSLLNWYISCRVYTLLWVFISFLWKVSYPVKILMSNIICMLFSYESFISLIPGSSTILESRGKVFPPLQGSQGIPVGLSSSSLQSNWKVWKHILHWLPSLLFYFPVLWADSVYWDHLPNKLRVPGLLAQDPILGESRLRKKRCFYSFI